MVRSGLQQDVINMYRQGVRNAMSKTAEARPAFLLHLRYNFRHPHLRPRDYTAIEHQLRRMSRTLEMLSDPSVQRISVSNEMRSWWDGEIAKGSTATSGSTIGSEKESDDRDQITKKDEQGRDRDQWAGKMPGHGGT
ncbi:hypothetical protein CI109_105724 [Kwoniella shandongensis]|uniref:Uncharacterized protein n=1 Tax=Kwoniella shandongensis TaxID=1734106 RepID=A0A5M6C3Y6_9TREE|nr:uncharacterized protein CI109_003064 [Kwoniella shandongensis]KAA5528532.1 hypothetical protein CI109_003064 [Kwoniella shandongensis]